MAQISSVDFTLILDDKDYQQLMNKLAGLTEVEQQAVINSALKDGSKLLTESGKQKLVATILHPEQSKGRLYQSMGVKVLKAKKNKGPVGYSGFKRSTKKEKGGGNAAHLVDRGTAERYTKKGYYRGKVKGSLFWTSTVESQGQKALEILMNGINEALNKLWDKN